MICLSGKAYKSMIEYAMKCLPNESCGLLGGTVKGKIRKVERVYMLSNMDASSTHFSMDPKEQFQAVRDMRANGFIMIGNFHSHPDGPAIPSKEDICLAYDSEIRYLILSLMDRENPEMKAFVIKDGSICEEEICINWQKN